MTALEKIKITLGISGSESDNQLYLLLEDVESDLLSWTNRKELPSSLESIQRQIVVMRYNKQGVEGQSSHSEGGISRSFEDLPPSIQCSINQFRLLKVATYETS